MLATATRQILRLAGARLAETRVGGANCWQQVIGQPNLPLFSLENGRVYLERRDD